MNFDYRPSATTAGGFLRLISGGYEMGMVTESGVFLLKVLS